MGYAEVLVTGGAGFIGSHLVEELVRGGTSVTVIDNLSTGRSENLGRHLKKKISFVKGDIRDKDAVDEAVSTRVEAVFHLAAITSVPYSFEQPNVTFEANVDGTRNLLEASQRREVERFVFVSSCAVYGDPQYLPVDERHSLKPMSPYAESKLEAEKACMEFSENYGLKVTILRPFNVYGPRQRKDQYSGVIAKFMERLHEGKPPVICGDGLQTRDFIHVEDAVRAFVLTLRTDIAVGRVFNVGTGVPTAINQLARLFLDLFDAEGIEPQYVNARPGDIKHSYADINEARIHLGFEPQVSLKDGLARLLRPQMHA